MPFKSATIRSTSIIGLILPLLTLSSCTEQFWPELEELNQFVVVDGMVTNSPGPYTVTLAYSGAKSEPITNAEVFIIEEDGDRHLLIERYEGEYYSDSLAFQAKVGGSYRLEFMLEDGSLYESPFSTILPNPGIDTVRGEAQWRYFDELQEEIPGYQFFVSSNPTPDNRDIFLLWQMEGTYEYTADYPAYYIFSGNLYSVDNIYEYYTCWRTYKLSQMVAADTRSLQQKQVIGKPLVFLKGNDKKLSHRYSLLTRQLSVNKETYEFWEAVIEQGFPSASLYSAQPYLIKGNVSNTQDPEEPVLGYFTVAGASESRIYQNNPPEFEVTYNTCALDYDSIRWIWGLPPSEWPIFITQGDEGLALSGDGCIDCRAAGGQLTPPDWWVE